MRAVLWQRIAALAGAALLSLVVALDLQHRFRKTPAAAAAVLPAEGSVASWQPALATDRTTPRTRSACGYLLTPKTPGVGNEVLPCGARIFILFHGDRVLTRVVDRGPRIAAAEFELTPALADRLGLHGIQAIRWTFARR